MSVGKLGATRCLGATVSAPNLLRVVPDLSTRSLATFTLCPHGVRLQGRPVQWQARRGADDPGRLTEQGGRHTMRAGNVRAPILWEGGKGRRQYSTVSQRKRNGGVERQTALAKRVDPRAFLPKGLGRGLIVSD